MVFDIGQANSVTIYPKEYTLSGTYRIKDSGWYIHSLVGTS